MAGIPFKLCVDEKMQIGIVAKSFKHLKAVAQEKFGLSENISVFLDDGTLVCDEDYFHMLEPQTKLTVRDNWQGMHDSTMCTLTCSPELGSSGLITCS